MKILERNPKKISKIKTFIVKQAPTIALNVLYAKNEKIYPAYDSKNNSNCGKQIILLMIPTKGKVWYYIAVKMLLALLRRIRLKSMVIFIA